MRCARLVLFVLVRGLVGWTLLGTTLPCSAALFYHRPTFERGSTAAASINFEGLAGSPSYYTEYADGFASAGVTITAQVPGLPEPSVFVIDPLYHSDYDRGSGDVLSSGTLDGKLVLELPAGTRAVGFDVVTFGGPADNTAFAVASSGGPDPELRFGQVDGPESGRGFVGFTSATPFARVTITPSASTIMFIDNVRIGQVSAALLPGDANGDGFVDGADYTRWADYYSQVGRSFDQGDFNSDGIVDGADYTEWADHFTSRATFGAVATPEPSTLLLGCAGTGIVVTAALRAARRRQK
jgi:hypothetical protein